MKRAPRSLQHHVLYRKYNGQDSEISALLGKCGFKPSGKSESETAIVRVPKRVNTCLKTKSARKNTRKQAEAIKRLYNDETGEHIGWLYKWNNGDLVPRWITDDDPEME